MPIVTRPPDTRWTVAAAQAVSAGSRVTGLVTAVPSPIVDVACAASARPTQQSAVRFCESTTAKPSHPASSAAFE